MKKLTIVLSLALASLLMAPTAVHAADTTDTTSKTSTATLEVQAGTGSLNLKQVPDFHFSAGTAEADASLATDTTNTDVIVEDNRGTGAGWSLSLTRGAFSDLSTQPTLSWNTNTTSATAGNIAPTISSATQVTAGQSGVVLENAAQGTGTGDTTLKMNSVSLSGVTVPAITKNYTATLTWSLGDTQTAN